MKARHTNWSLYFLNFSQSLEAPRRIYHYWYTAWPDHGVPDSPRQFLRLVEEVNVAQEREDVREGPVVVHCRLVITHSISDLIITQGSH